MEWCLWDQAIWERNTEETSNTGSKTKKKEIPMEACGLTKGKFGTLGDKGGDSGDQTAVQSGSEGMLVGDEEGDSDEGKAERGEGPGVGMKRRESWKNPERSGRWAGDGVGPSGENIELRRGMSRRSVSRQSK